VGSEVLDIPGRHRMRAVGDKVHKTDVLDLLPWLGRVVLADRGLARSS
jgi:hypothetical protein